MSKDDLNPEGAGPDPTRGTYGTDGASPAPVPPRGPVIAPAPPPFVQRARKLLAAVAGVLAQVVALNVLPPQWQPYAAVLVAVATAAGVYAVPNAQPADPDEPAPYVPTTRYDPPTA